MIPGLGHEPGGAPLDRCSPCIPGISEIQRYYRVRGYGLRNGPAVGWRVEVSDTRFGGGLSGYEGALMVSGTLGAHLRKNKSSALPTCQSLLARHKAARATLLTCFS